MDRQEAIEVAKLMRQKFIEATEHMEANSLCVQAIDTLIAPIPVTDEMIRKATDRFLDTAFFTEQGQSDIAYVPLGDVERSIGLTLTAALGGDDATN